MSELIKFIRHNKHIVWINMICLSFLVIYVFTENSPELFPHGSAIMDIFESLSLATISASIFYYITIFKAQIKATQMYKKALKRELTNLKDAIIHDLIYMCRIDIENTNVLHKPSTFYNVFKDFGWNEIMNLLSDDQWTYNKIKTSIKQMSLEIDSVLKETPFYDPIIANKLRTFKKVTDERIVLIESTEEGGYDNIRYLTGLLFEMLGGWSMIEGKTNRDFLQEAIDAL